MSPVAAAAFHHHHLPQQIFGNSRPSSCRHSRGYYQLFTPARMRNKNQHALGVLLIARPLVVGGGCGRGGNVIDPFLVFGGRRRRDVLDGRSRSSSITILRQQQQEVNGEGGDDDNPSSSHHDSSSSASSWLSRIRRLRRRKKQTTGSSAGGGGSAKAAAAVATTISLEDAVRLKKENAALREAVQQLEVENERLHQEVNSRIVLETFEGEGKLRRAAEERERTLSISAGGGGLNGTVVSSVAVAAPPTTTPFGFGSGEMSQSMTLTGEEMLCDDDDESLWCDVLEEGACPVEPTVSFGEALRDRAYWLVGLLILQSLSGIILARNEALLSDHPVSTLLLFSRFILCQARCERLAHFIYSVSLRFEFVNFK